jgi:hypothetical protein
LELSADGRAEYKRQIGKKGAPCTSRGPYAKLMQKKGGEKWMNKDFLIYACSSIAFHVLQKQEGHEYHSTQASII